MYFLPSGEAGWTGKWAVVDGVVVVVVGGGGQVDRAVEGKMGGLVHIKIMIQGLPLFGVWVILYQPPDGRLDAHSACSGSESEKKKRKV